jgi:hypothetical protein
MAKKTHKPTLSKLATRELLLGNTLDEICAKLRPISEQRGHVWPKNEAALRAHIAWLSKRGWTAEWSADKSAARIIPTPGFTGKRVFGCLLEPIEDTAANEIVDDIKEEDAATNEIVDDIKEIEKRDLNQTTKKALIDARIGQGKFREKLEKRWNQACSVTGCKIRKILRASHIKPWKCSSDKERLDAENGLLLTANLDAAFDSGLISFSDQGEMLVSDQLSEKQRDELGVPRPLREHPSPGQAKYLRVHRKHWGFQ